MSQPLLSVRGLRKRFGGLIATDNVDLDVVEGEIHALIGPNGAGKTTLLTQLFGELSHDEGEIRLEGGRSMRWRRRSVSSAALPAPSRSTSCCPISACSIMSRSPCRPGRGTASASSPMPAATRACVSAPASI
jgi:ABC-type hemin transport system ATPase subunit